MMSDRSFSNNLLKLEKDLFRRRNWVLAIALFLHFIIFVAGMLIGLMDVSRSWDHSSSAYTTQILSTTQYFFGLTSPVFIIAILLGVLLAIQGFSWLFSRRELDFYFSQPVSGKMRFVSIYLNGILIYVISYLLMLAVGLLAALPFGALTRALADEALAEFIRCLILFLGVYHIALLAVMWTGTLIWAILGSAFLLFVEYVVLILVDGYRSLYYSTYVSYFLEPKVSAIYNYLIPAQNAALYSLEETGYLSGASLAESMRSALPYDARALVTAAVILVCVLVSWRIRKPESAGTAIIFRPIRITVRIMTSVIAGLISGLAFFSTMISGSSASMVWDLFCMVLVTLLTAVILQMLFERNFLAGFRSLIPALCAAVIVIGLSLFYRLDLSGFDSYLPDESSVESCALYVEDGYSIYEAEGRHSFNTNYFAENTMYLTDITSVEKLAQTAIDALKEDTDSGIYISVLYRMKNGKEIRRSYLLPRSHADAEPLNAILSSSEYKNSRFPITAENAESEQVVLTYHTTYATQTVTGEYYTLLKNAYTADLQNYDYTLASSEHPVGMLTVSYKDSSLSRSYPVYESYSHTSDFLRETGLWIKSYPEPSDIEELTIVHLVSETSYIYSDAYYAESEEEIVITDPDEIRDILAVTYNNAFDEGWHFGNEDYDDYYYGTYKTTGGATGPYYGLLSFAAGDVPLFVKSRFSENRYTAAG